MVKLINVKCEAETASCEFMPEGEGKPGFVRVNRKNVIEYVPAEGYGTEDYSPDLNHVAGFLYKTFSMEKVPKEATIYWY